MFQKPQRPYYIYSDDQVPGDAAAERDVMNRSRLRRLIRDLTQRQTEVKAAHEQKNKKTVSAR